jgi:hypothetical protein
LLLTQTLRRRGLVVQTAKTKILIADQARQQFEDIRLILDEVKDEFLQKLREAANLNNASLAMTEVDKILSGMESTEPAEVLEEAYWKNFIEAQNDFNKSLFRFLLNRLGSAGNHCALEHALGVLKEHPEETDAILSYAAALGEVAAADTASLGSCAMKTPFIHIRNTKYSSGGVLKCKIRQTN